METFSSLLVLCVGNSPVTGEFPSQRPVTQSFDVFFDLCLNKQLSKKSRGWWFEMPSRSLYAHYDVIVMIIHDIMLNRAWWCLKVCKYARLELTKDIPSQIAKFMGPTWGPPGSCRPQMGPMLAPWTLLLGMACPTGQAMGCLLWVYGRKFTLL